MFQHNQPLCTFSIEHRAMTASELCSEALEIAAMKSISAGIVSSRKTFSRYDVVMAALLAERQALRLERLLRLSSLPN